ncbi:MAG: hypothetical protein ACR2LL_05620 [Nitrosopumilus sp.]
MSQVQGKKAWNEQQVRAGQKRCSQCEIFINWEGKHCPCCGYVLRTKPKGTQTRHRLMIVQQAKRI